MNNNIRNHLLIKLPEKVENIVSENTYFNMKILANLIGKEKKLPTLVISLCQPFLSLMEGDPLKIFKALIMQGQ